MSFFRGFTRNSAIAYIYGLVGTQYDRHRNVKYDKRKDGDYGE